MEVTCPSCSFRTQTAGEGFRLREEDVKFCLKCGTPYPEGMVARLYSADEASRKYKTKAAFQVIGLVVLALVADMAWVMSRNPFMDHHAIVSSAFMLAVVVLALISLFVILMKGDRKFKKLSGQLH